MDANKKKKDFIDLWTKVWPDNSNELDFYCDQIVKDPNNIISIYDGEVCAATLSIVNLKFNYQGEELPMAIITSFIIHPDFRHANYELDLMFYASNYIYKNQFSLIACYCLHPKLKPLYQRRWQAMSSERRKKVHLSCSNSKDTFSKFTVERTTRNIEAEYNALIARHYRNYVIHPSASFDYIGKESDFFLAHDAQGSMVGIAIRINYCDDGVVSELIADNGEVAQALVDEMCAHYNWTDVEYECYDKTSKDGQGMLRIANAQVMLDIYAQKHPELCDSFNIDDQIIMGNTGSYLIKDGHCSMIPEDSSLRTATIRELNELILDEYNINLALIY